MTDSASAIRTAYAQCRRLARRHYENFPVASYLIPRDRRDALAAIYAFARYADDLADEPNVQGRLEQLAEWRRKLVDCSSGKADHPVFLALADTLERFHLSRVHFANLLQAFESDVRVTQHQDFSSLLAYCAYSANPVGRLVLELFGHRERELYMLSDDLCTALQLANFWQDVVLDLQRGRIYLPLEDLRRFGYSVDDLRAQRQDERWRALMALEVARTRERFERAKGLPEKVTPDLRLQLRLTWWGGMTILARIESVRFDIFRQRPKLHLLDFVRLYLKARRALKVDKADPAPAAASLP